MLGYSLTQGRHFLGGLMELICIAIVQISPITHTEMQELADTARCNTAGSAFSDITKSQAVSRGERNTGYMTGQIRCHLRSPAEQHGLILAVCCW